jgi:hypothetical protein
MREGKNTGIMITLKKTYLRKASPSPTPPCGQQPATGVPSWGPLSGLVRPSPSRLWRA